MITLEGSTLIGDVDLEEFLTETLSVFSFEGYSSALAAQVQSHLEKSLTVLRDEGKISYFKVNACAKPLEGSILVNLQIKGPIRGLIKRINITVAP